MTVRSALTRLPSERPKISFVFPVHDPDYGGGLLGRTQRHLDALIALANRYQLASEIIIVEWNPRQDRAPFRESLHWPGDLGHVCLRFIEVPAEIHRTLPNADKIPIFEYIAKNAGLRRARGQFLLATNPDLFYSPALMRWLARASLSPGSFYRVDRRDLSEEIPADLELARRLRFCSRHVERVHAFFGSYRPGDSDLLRRLKEEYDRCLHDPTRAKQWTPTPEARLTFPADGLHRNASGDFFLMEREWWHRLRGYPELYTHAHIDAILCWVAASAGLVQELLPSRCHLYHQAHDRESRTGFPQTDKKPWYQRYQDAMRQAPSGKDSPLVVNFPDWGLANEVLPEWQVSSRLVQVQVLTKASQQEKHFASSLAAAEHVPGNSTQQPAEAETSLPAIRSQLRHAQAGLDAAGQREAALKVALRKEQSGREAERAAAKKVLHKVQRVRNAERAALKAAVREAQAAQRSEVARRHTLESSIAWRITWPVRRALASFSSRRPAPRRSVDPHRVEDRVSDASTQGLVTQPKQDPPEKIRHAPPEAPEASDRGALVDLSAPTATHDAAPSLAPLESQRSAHGRRVSSRLTVCTPNSVFDQVSPVTVQHIRQVLANLTESEFIELIPDLSAVLRRTGTEYWWMKRQLFEAFEAEGFHVTQAHFYSPQPTITELSPALWDGPFYETPAFVADMQGMKTLFQELSVFANELADVPRTGQSGFYWDNAFFPNFDALIYYGLCRRFRPKVVLEVGSGFSTHIALRAADKNAGTQVHCIEPHPTATLKAVEGRLSQILVQRVQDVPLDVFSKLERNDILFVDTAHVSKTGGDLNHLLFKVLPCLPPGVLVHFHDIFLPYEYPHEWIAGRNWFWNEQYLLLAFLMYNMAFRTLFMNQRFLREQGSLVTESLGGLNLGPLQGASFWLCREHT